VNRADVDALPAVVDVTIAAEVLGLSRHAAYELIRCGTWPTPVFRLGRLIRIPTAPLLDLLGLSQLSTAAVAKAPVGPPSNTEPLALSRTS
jgi:hypothetical protein